jgi:hypothetical protein
LAQRYHTLDRPGPDASSPAGTCARSARIALLAFCLAGWGLAASPERTEGQVQALIPSRLLSLSLGQALASYDDDCDDPESFLTHARASLITGRYGVSVAYVHEDWPWPPDEELGGEFLLRHGDAFQLVGEAYPLGFLPFGESRVGRMLRPFVGAGVQVSGDGEPGGAAGRAVYAVGGSVDPIAVVGASLFVRTSVLPTNIHIQYRHTALFASDFELQGPTGGVVEVDGETLTWGELSVGFSIPIGG